MKNIQLYDVAPSIPKEIRFLETLGRNLWWCWSPDAIDLFRRISPELWRESGLNPLQFLLMVPQERMEGLAVDDGFLTQMKHVQAGFEEACATAGTEPARDANICYFSLEYGIHESVRLYSGGLGVLAGDHLKAASDMNLPLVAVGLLYHQGYFRQYLDSQDMQQEAYPKAMVTLHKKMITQEIGKAHFRDEEKFFQQKYLLDKPELATRKFTKREQFDPIIVDALVDEFRTELRALA
jgi:starch phosphorylase